MKILDSGDHPLSNADVLDWVNRKRAQHAREDAENKKADLPEIKRPSNFMRMLNRTERELASDRYPYTKNPSIYKGEQRNESFRKFALELENTLQDRLEAEWKDRLATMKKQQRDAKFAPEQDKKCLTQSELLMVFNHAPTNPEMLQPMIERSEERFAPEELQIIVDVVVRTLRKNEYET